MYRLLLDYHLLNSRFKIHHFEKMSCNEWIYNFPLLWNNLEQQLIMLNFAFFWVVDFVENLSIYIYIFENNTNINSLEVWSIKSSHRTADNRFFRHNISVFSNKDKMPDFLFKFLQKSTHLFYLSSKTDVAKYCCRGCGAKNKFLNINNLISVFIK